MPAKIPSQLELIDFFDVAPDPDNLRDGVLLYKLQLTTDTVLQVSFSSIDDSFQIIIQGKDSKILLSSELLEKIELVKTQGMRYLKAHFGVSNSTFEATLHLEPEFKITWFLLRTE
jgi:hypothetical protein